MEAAPPLSPLLQASDPAPAPTPTRANVEIVRFTRLVDPQLEHAIGSFAADMLRSTSNLVWQSLQ